MTDNHRPSRPAEHGSASEDRAVARPRHRRRYSRAQEAEAVGLAAAVGQRAASEQTGIPKTTIQQWFHKPEYDHLRSNAREQVAEAFWVAIQIGLQAVRDGFESGPLKDKAMALGVLYDRYALLTGGATARTEARDITGSLSDSELVAAVREADRIASGHGASPPAEDPPEG